MKIGLMQTFPFFPNRLVGFEVWIDGDVTADKPRSKPSSGDTQNGHGFSPARHRQAVFGARDSHSGKSLAHSADSTFGSRSPPSPRRRRAMRGSAPATGLQSMGDDLGGESLALLGGLPDLPAGLWGVLSESFDRCRQGVVGGIGAGWSSGFKAPTASVRPADGAPRPCR